MDVEARRRTSIGIFGATFICQMVGYYGIMSHQDIITLVAGIGVVGVLAGAFYIANKDEAR